MPHRITLAAIAGVTQQADTAVLPGNPSGVVAGSVVHDNQLTRIEAPALQPLQHSAKCAGQSLFFVVGRDDNRQRTQRRCRWSFRTGCQKSRSWRFSVPNEPMLEMAKATRNWLS